MKKRMKALTSVLVALSLPISGSMAVFGAEQTQAADSFQADLESKYVEPAMEYWPEARWWLAEGSHTDETIAETIQSAYDSGLGAIEFATLEAGVAAET